MAFAHAVPLRDVRIARNRVALCEPRRCANRHRNPAQMLSQRPFASKVASGALKLLIRSLCTIADDLEVDINASSNLAVLQGKLNGVTMTASRLVYNGFAISGGAAVHTDQILLEPAYPASLASPPRLAKPFSVSVRATLTEADLNRAGPVRDALEQLLREIVRTGLGGAVGHALPAAIGGLTCVLHRVELDDAAPPASSLFRWSLTPRDAGGKLVLRASAALSSGKLIRFAVRTGLCTMQHGQVLKLSDPELMWRNVCLPLITIDTIGVQLDPSSKLTNVDIDKGALSADGFLVILPALDYSSQTLNPTNVRARNGQSGAPQPQDSSQRKRLPRRPK